MLIEIRLLSVAFMVVAALSCGNLAGSPADGGGGADSGAGADAGQAADGGALQCLWEIDCDPDAGVPQATCGGGACIAYCIRPAGLGGHYCAKPCANSSECGGFYACCGNAGGSLPETMCLPVEADGGC